jgi:hypothetical protein
VHRESRTSQYNSIDAQLWRAGLRIQAKIVDTDLYIALGFKRRFQQIIKQIIGRNGIIYSS